MLTSPVDCATKTWSTLNFLPRAIRGVVSFKQHYFYSHKVLLNVWFLYQVAVQVRSENHQGFMLKLNSLEAGKEKNNITMNEKKRKTNKLKETIKDNTVDAVEEHNSLKN